MIGTEKILTLFALIMLTGMIFGKVSGLVKLPDVVLYLFAGIIIGPAVLGIVGADDFPLGNQLILTFGSAFILYEGGREIKLKILNKVKITVTLLSTLGVGISAFFMAFVIMKIFNMEFIYALLLGSVIASTDPATLIPVFKQVKIKDRVKQTVISESAFNDAAGAILVFSVLAIIQSGNFSLGNNLKELMVMIIGGIVIGFVIGFVFSIAISDTKYGFFHEYAPIMSVVTVVVSYVIAEKVGGSGYMATFVAGLVCGNKKTFKLWVPEVDFISQFHFRETLATIMRMAIFVLLGAHVDFAALQTYWVPSLIAVLVLVFIARPLSVIFCTLPDREAKWSKNETIFIMWVRETGVIPAALSGIIVGMKIPGYEIISSVVFMTIIITLVFQASTTKALAKKLDLLEEDAKPITEEELKVSVH